MGHRKKGHRFDFKKSVRDMGGENMDFKKRSLFCMEKFKFNEKKYIEINQ